MSIATRAITRIRDADDAPSLGAGQDGYALTWNNATGAFAATALFGGGLLATGATTGATAQAQAFTLGVTVGGVTTAATLLQVAETSTASPRGIMSSQHNTGSNGACFHMRKSRGTNAIPTVITTGDTLGLLSASGYDGSNYLEMGGIEIVSAGTIASTRVPTEMRFLTATDAAPSVLTQRMVISKDGNVGIGTTSPLYPLHIQHAVELPQILLQTSLAAGRAGIGFKTSTDTGNSYIKTALFFHRYGTNGRGVIGLANNFVADGSNVSYTDMRLFLDQNGYVGIGDFVIASDVPATILHARSSTAATNAVANIVTLGANVTGAGVGATGLGSAILFQAESSTTADTSQARIASSWIVATHASRTSRLALSAYDTAEREGIRIDSDGAAALLGFYGHAAVAQQVLATGAGATADNIITALQALGLVKQS